MALVASMPIHRWMQPPTFWQSIAGHVLLLVQVVDVLVDVGETVDPLAGEMGDGRAQLLILRLERFVEGGADGVDAIHLEFVRPVDQPTIEIDVALHLG